MTLLLLASFSYAGDVDLVAIAERDGLPAAGEALQTLVNNAKNDKKLQKELKGDREELNKQLMELYKERGVNPAAGCWPMLIQIPFFIAFYWVLLESVEMRQAPFMLWITDLSVRDPYFILPLLMGAAMYFQQQLNPPPPDPMQAKVMQFLPVMFTAMFAFFPAGLVLYWLTNSGTSSARLYWESFNTAFSGDGDNSVKVPTGVSSFPKEIVRTPRSWAEKRYPDIRYWNNLDKGGHFAAFEQPELFVEEMRAWQRAVNASI